MSKIKAGIINVTGYAGSELARLLFVHPEVEITSVTGRSAAGQKLADVFPHLADINLTIESEPGDVDIAFSAMPHKASAEVLLPLIKKGIKVIDISADFRLKNPQDYSDWYGFDHPAPELLEKAVFGLPELYRSGIKGAQVVANPGCYPTSAILALAPAIKAGIIKPDIIIDSKSGISGAGRTLSLGSHFAEATESVSAYSLQGHRHLPEIVQELSFVSSGFKPQVTFLPHLIPMSRGILSSCYAGIEMGKLAAGAEELLQLYSDFYKGEPFVRVVSKPPATKHTSGTNFCLVHPAVDKRTGRIIVISCLDNLIKGAAGQAIQNMNIMLGFPETTGLEGLAVFP